MSQTEDMETSVGRTRQELIELLEHLTMDLRRGRPTFIALAVITPSAHDPTLPVVAVGKYGRGPMLHQVNEAFARLASAAQDLGVLVPD